MKPAGKMRCYRGSSWFGLSCMLESRTGFFIARAFRLPAVFVHKKEGCVLGKIRLLDREVAELIAAGEVIDRPASACKELVENAMDAGAHKITVEISRGGIQLLRVTDDGSGIAPEDVPAAFLRHATSKLRQAQELYQIRTMGFRGEALASVAAMARVELITRTEGADMGVRYCIEGGEETACGAAGCPLGTTIFVRDLFYNTPARMKFLKRDVTEAGAVAGVLEHAAVSRPDIAFTLIRDGKPVLQTPGNSRAEDAVYAVWGRDFFHTLAPLEYDAGGVRVRGFVSKPAEGRGNRGMQQFFVNGRPIRSKLLTAALEQGYRESMMKGKFPACVLDILLPPGVYDVNVHPAKLEVRFADEKRVFDAVYYGVKSALLPLDPQGIEMHLPASSAASVPQPPEEKKTAVSPDYALPKPLKPLEPVLRQDPAAVIPAASGLSRPSFQDSLPEEAPAAAEKNFQAAPVPSPSAAGEAPLFREALAEKAPGRFGGARLIGELLGTYLLLECDGQLILIDKHAAHERLLYERLKREEKIESQVLLTPAAVTLPRGQVALLLAEQEALGRMGFSIEDFGGGSLLIREIPTMLPLEDAAGSIAGFAQELEDGGKAGRVQRLDELYHSMACKAAIKAHDRNDPLELEALVGLLGEHEEVRFCPHGRPIAVALSTAQIEKMFGRRT
jgi:DNA mismatch repair protein MutL